MKITTEKVYQAYQETNLKPICGEFYTPDYQCACALSVLYAHKVNKDNPQSALKELNEIDGYELLERIKDELNLDKDINLRAFWYGFDLITCVNYEVEEDYKLGKKIRYELEEKLGYALDQRD